MINIKTLSVNYLKKQKLFVKMPLDSPELFNKAGCILSISVRFKSDGSVNSTQTRLAHGEIVRDTKADLRQIVFLVLAAG